MQDLISTWKEGKKALAGGGSTEQLIAGAKEKKRKIVYAHFGNIAILAFTLIIISLFFYYRIPFTEPFSNAGMCMMLGGLALRIVIEIMSILKSSAIQMSHPAEQVNKAALAFYIFRKKIHGPVTIIIVMIYVVGFYLLSPEFSRYISFQWMIIMHVSFIPGALFLIWLIRKGINKEMANLEHLSNLRKEIIADEGQQIL